MAELTADVLGSSVLHRPASGDPVEITSIFRTDPIEVLNGDNGAVLISAPTWRVPLSRAGNIANGDLVEPWDGETYRVLNRLPTASPAADRYMIFELEQTT